MSHLPLEIKNLTKVYPNGFTAVKDISFSIKPGEVYGLLGMNGAGKTSIISCIMTLERMTKGQISILGHDIIQSPYDAKLSVGFVPQEVISYGFFSVDEILNFFMGFYGYKSAEHKDFKDYILETLDLMPHKNKNVKSLSGGMKRRMLIARALLHRPKLVLLDEPTAGVDIQLREKVKDLIRKLSSEGVAFLLTTHYLEEAQQLCNQIGVMHEGQMIKEGTPETLIKELSSQKISMKIPSRSDISHPYLENKHNDIYTFNLPYQSSLQNLLEDLNLNLPQISSLKVREGSLEDAFSGLVLNKQKESTNG